MSPQQKVRDLHVHGRAYQLRNILDDWKSLPVILKELDLNAPSTLKILNRWIDAGTVEIQYSRNKHGILVAYYRSVATNVKVPDAMQWTDSQLRAAILASVPVTPMEIVQSVLIDLDYLLSVLNSMHRAGILKKTISHLHNRGCVKTRKLQELYYLAD